MEENSPKPEENQAKIAKASLAVKMVDFGLEFAVILILPLVAGVLVGKWLDTKYHHKFYVVIGLLAALFISGFTIYRKIKDYQRLIK